MDGGLVVAPGREPREVAHVDDRRRVVERPACGGLLERHGRLGDRAARTRRRCRRSAPPGSMPGSAGPPSPKLRVIQIEPSFFGKPWIQPRVEREVAVDPDVRAGRDLLAVEQRR